MTSSIKKESTPLKGAIEAALRSYRCEYSFDDDGNNLPLVDLLSWIDVGETIEVGVKEILLLTEHVAKAIELKEQP